MQALSYDPSQFQDNIIGTGCAVGDDTVKHTAWIGDSVDPQAYSAFRAQSTTSLHLLSEPQLPKPMLPKAPTWHPPEWQGLAAGTVGQPRRQSLQERMPHAFDPQQAHFGEASYDLVGRTASSRSCNQHGEDSLPFDLSVSDTVPSCPASFPTLPTPSLSDTDGDFRQNNMVLVQEPRSALPQSLHAQSSSSKDVLRRYHESLEQTSSEPISRIHESNVTLPPVCSHQGIAEAEPSFRDGSASDMPPSSSHLPAANETRTQRRGWFGEHAVEVVAADMDRQKKFNSWDIPHWDPVHVTFDDNASGSVSTLGPPSMSYGSLPPTSSVATAADQTLSPSMFASHESFAHASFGKLAFSTAAPTASRAIEMYSQSEVLYLDFEALHAILRAEEQLRQELSCVDQLIRDRGLRRSDHPFLSAPGGRKFAKAEDVADRDGLRDVLEDHSVVICGHGDPMRSSHVHSEQSNVCYSGVSEPNDKDLMRIVELDERNALLQHELEEIRSRGSGDVRVSRLQAKCGSVAWGRRVAREQEVTECDKPEGMLSAPSILQRLTEKPSLQPVAENCTLGDSVSATGAMSSEQDSFGGSQQSSVAQSRLSTVEATLASVEEKIAHIRQVAVEETPRVVAPCTRGLSDSNPASDNLSIRAARDRCDLLVSRLCEVSRAAEARRKPAQSLRVVCSQR